MKLVNPPVALMFHEGARRLLAAGLHVPALADGDKERVALEAYPGLLVRKQLGIRDSYKSDNRNHYTAARRMTRKRIVTALCESRPLGVAVRLKARASLIRDGSGDFLDAVVCGVQAAWATTRPHYGLSRRLVDDEGWIVSA
jgi:hypothetical protein